MWIMCTEYVRYVGVIGVERVFVFVLKRREGAHSDMARGDVIPGTWYIFLWIVVVYIGDRRLKRVSMPPIYAT